MNQTNQTEKETAAAEKMNPKMAVLRFLQGALIGLGAVLPGISGGVLCVIFGVYRIIMEVLSHPFQALRKYYKLLIPLIIGGAFGFVVVSKLLGYLLETYPDPSVCLFVGLIGGMIPSLFREAGKKGVTKGSYISLGACFCVVLALLITLNVVQVEIVPNFGWYLFCGFCIALSVIAPGMSFSTLTMPLGLYTPLVSGIGNFDFGVLIPAGIGALLTVILLAKAVDSLLEHHYSVVFHGIIGIVIAATLVIIPYTSFTAGAGACAANVICLVVGVVVALALDKFNSKIEVPED